MPVKLQNLTDRPVLLALATGDIVRLSPGETSEDLEEVAVHASDKIDKLRAQGVIEVHGPSKRSSTKKARRTTKTEHDKTTAEDEDMPPK